MKTIKYGGSMCGRDEEYALVRSIKKSIKTGNWQAGEETKKFEEELAKAIDVNFAVMTSSGSCAALLALAALELPKGSEVIIPAVTFPTVFNVIPQCGLIPVVVDCEVGTYNINLDKLEQAVGPKTKAIIAVHALGNPVDMPRLMRMVNKASARMRGQKIWVIEDNCDGFGTTLNGQMMGSFGDISFTSTHAAHIITTGVGGIVFTDNPRLIRNVRMYRDWGRQADTNQKNRHKELPKDYNPRFIYEKIGWNFQILELQSAMGRVQLKKAKKIKELRSRNLRYICAELKKKYPLRFVLPHWIEGASVCPFAIGLTFNGDRGLLVKHLEANGIETRSMFSGNITKHPAYKNTEYRIGNELSGADKILKQSFWIGCHPSMTTEDRQYVLDVFDSFFAKHYSYPTKEDLC